MESLALPFYEPLIAVCLCSPSPRLLRKDLHAPSCLGYKCQDGAPCSPRLVGVPLPVCLVHVFSPIAGDHFLPTADTLGVRQYLLSQLRRLSPRDCLCL